MLFHHGYYKAGWGPREQVFQMGSYMQQEIVLAVDFLSTTQVKNNYERCWLNSIFHEGPKHFSWIPKTYIWNKSFLFYMLSLDLLRVASLATRILIRNS